MSTDLLRHALSGATMGTRWTGVLYATSGTDIAALEAALARTVDRVDRQMSSWKPDSDLMRFNVAPPGTWVALPPELMRVLARGLEIGRASDGAFDIGLGSLVHAWGFGAARGALDPEAIRAALGEVLPPAHAIVELDRTEGRARRHARSALDLSAIAKGCAVDEMMRTVESFGIADALVGLDGELKARGIKADGTPWLVAVERPDYALRSAMGTVELRDAAVATSGDYRHWIDLNGRRLSHTMDRARGGPVDNGIASVSVVADSCMDADAWATALMVLGPAQGEALAQRHGFDALFIRRAGGMLTEIPVGPTFRSAPLLPARMAGPGDGAAASGLELRQ